MKEKRKLGEKGESRKERLRTRENRGRKEEIERKDEGQEKIGGERRK